MNQPTELDPVVRRVNKPQLPLEPGETLVRYNAESKQILPRDPLFLSRKNLRYYIVGVSGTSRHEVTKGRSLAIPIIDFVGDRRLEVIVLFRASCPPGNEQKVVQAVAVEDKPINALQFFLERIVRENTSKDPADFIDHYEERRTVLAAEIERRVRSEIGLDLAVRIILRYEENLAAPPFEDIVAVKVSDDKDDHSLALSVELEVDPQQRVLAILHYPQLETINDRVRKAALSFVQRKVSLHAFHTELAQGKLLDELRSAIDDAVRAEGRRVSRIFAKPADRGAATESFVPLQIVVPEVPRESHEQITITNDLQLKLADFGKWKNAGIANLSEWTDTTLRRIIKETVFEKKYTDFLLNFDPLAEDVKKRMTEEAVRIGYELKHFVTTPQLKESELVRLRSYPWEFPDLPTQSANIPVSLLVVATLAIPDLRKIERYLNKDISVEGMMKNTVKEVLENELHRSHPETVYMRFVLPGPCGEPSLAARLQDRVHQALRHEFAAEVSSVVIKTLDTEIKTFVDGLLGQFREFEVELLPHSGSDLFTFVGEITVTGIAEDGWPMIQARNFTINTIKQYFQGTLQAGLETCSDAELSYYTPRHREQIEVIVNNIAGERISQQFGVYLRVDNFRRLHADSRRQRAKLHEQLRHEELTADERRLSARSFEDEKALERSKVHAQFRLDKDKKVMQAIEQRVALDGDQEAQSTERLSEKLKQQGDGAEPPSYEEIKRSLADKAQREIPAEGKSDQSALTYLGEKRTRPTPERLTSDSARTAKRDD